MPGKKRKKFTGVEESDDEDKFFLNEEDELLDQVDKHERDFKDMLNYLNEVEEMMGGNDLAQIRKMMRYQNETMDQHIKAYDKIKTSVTEMNKEALETLKGISKYAPEMAEFIQDNERQNIELER